MPYAFETITGMSSIIDPTPGEPLVSVAMATHNGERFVDEQLRSILDELAPTDEVIVVDDASRDSTVARLAALQDARVRVLGQHRNMGVRASFDRALRACRGRYVFLSDQDDRWRPGKRVALVEALQHGALLALSDARVIDAEGHVIEESFMAGRGGFRGSALATLVRNRYLGCAMAFRRELLEQALPIPANVPQHDMWIGMLAALDGPVSYLPQPLIDYRRHAGNLSPRRRAGLGQMLVWRWRLVQLTARRRWRGRQPVTNEEIA